MRRMVSAFLLLLWEQVLRDWTEMIETIPFSAVVQQQHNTHAGCIKKCLSCICANFLLHYYV